MSSRALLATTALVLAAANFGAAAPPQNPVFKYTLTGSGVFNDGYGIYVSGQGGVESAWEGNDFRSVTCIPKGANSSRVVVFDFTHPADPLNALLYGIWPTTQQTGIDGSHHIRISNLKTMAVGETRQVGLRASHPNPDVFGNHISCAFGTVLGRTYPGTVAGTATHPTSTKWIVTTAANPIAECFWQIPSGMGPENMGPFPTGYYYSLPFEIEITQ